MTFRYTPIEEDLQSCAVALNRSLTGLPLDLRVVASPSVFSGLDASKETPDSHWLNMVSNRFTQVPNEAAEYSLVDINRFCRLAFYSTSKREALN